MDKHQIRTLLIEDNPVDAIFLREALEQDTLDSFDLTVVERLDAALETLQKNAFGIILLDLGLPDSQGLETFTQIHQRVPEIPKVILSGFTDESFALQAVHAGAQDYIVKGAAGFASAVRAIRYAIERQRTQTALQASEARYHRVLDTMMEGCQILSFDWHYLYINDAAEVHNRRPKDELLGRKFMDMWPGIEATELFAEIHYCMEKRIVTQMETEFIFPDGGQGYYNLSIQPVPEGVFILSTDITASKHARDALRANEERFRALIENGSDNISLLEANGTLIWESPAVVRNLGYPTNAFLGNNIFELVHPDDKAWTSDLFAKLIQTPGSRQRGAFRLQHSDGSWRWVEAVVQNLLDNSSVQAVVVNYRDITENKLAEIEIQQKNNDLGLINTINEGVIRGESLNVIMNRLAKELKRIFSSEGSAIYMLSPDGQSLTMQQYFLSPEINHGIEKLIGTTIPLIQIPTRAGGFFQKVLHAAQGTITSDPEEIQNWMREFVETAFLPPVAQGAIRKLIPQIYKLLNFKSVIVVPLISNEKIIGLMDVSSANLFTDDDLKRIENISRQLTAAILRQQANEKIQGSEEFLQSVQNALSANIAILDESGTIIRVNSAWRKFGEQNGLEHPEYAIGLNYLDICDSATGRYAEEAPLAAKAIREVIAGHRREASIEYPCHSPEEKRWFLLRITKFEDGDQIWVVLAHENISERKQAEEAVRETSEQFRTLFEASPEAITLIDPHGDWNILDCNATACAMNGYTREELVGQSVDVFNLTPGTPTERAEYLERIHNAGILRYETSHRRKDDTLFPVEVSTSLITLGGREVVLGIDRDITERKRAVDTLRESEALYRQAIEVAGAVPYRESYSDNGRSITFEFIGEGIRQITGYGPDEFNAQVWDSLAEEANLVDDLKGYTIDEGIQRVRSGENPIWKCEYRIRDRSGKIHWVFEAAVELRDEHGVSHGSIGTYQDITARKQAENALRESEQRYRALFEDMPVAIWEEDFSEIKKYLGALKEQGITDFHAYFTSNPDAALECANKVRILDVNNTAVKMFRGESKEQLLNIAEQEVSKGEREHLVEFITDIAEGKTNNHWEGGDETFTGDPIEIGLNWSVVPGYENDYSKVVVTTTDITERKWAEEKLRESEARFISIFHTNPTRVSITSFADGRFLDVNEAFLASSGYSREEVVGHMALELNDWVHPQDRLRLRALLEEQGSVQSFETQLRKKTGEILDILISAELIELFGQRCILSVGLDITERKRDEQKLLEANERFQQLADNIEESFWVTDAFTGEEIYVSQPAEKIWGRTVETMLQTPNYFLNNILPEDNTAALSALAKQKDGQRTETEYRIVQPNGAVRWVWDRAFPIFDAAGKVIRIAGVVADITERKQNEQKLLEANERFHQLADNIQEVFWITDAISGEDLYVSPAGEKIWGHSMEDLMHTPDIFMDTVLLEDRPVVSRIIEKQRNGQSTEMEYRIKKSDGSILWVWDRAFPIFDEAGKVVRLAGIAADITERKLAEKDIARHLTELEALYENGLAVGQLLDQSEIGERIITTFARHLSWHHVAIRLRRPESDELELIAFNQPGLSDDEKTRIEQHFNSMINKVGQGLSGWVAQTGQPLRTGNVHAQPQYIHTHPNIQSGLYMPLKLGEHSIGVISVESEEPNAFSEQDERLLATLANQAAIAFENARLYQTAWQELQERKRVEIALRTSETHYRELADSITDIFFELDHDLRYSHWNKASELLTGVIAKDAIGKSMREIFGESDEQVRIEKIYKDVLGNHRSRTFETPFVVNRQQRAFEVNAYPSTRGVSVVAKDVTERKRSETIMQKRFELMEYSAQHSLDDVMEMMTNEVCNLTGSAIAFFQIMEADQTSSGLQTWPINTLNLFDIPISEGQHRAVEQAGVWAEAVRQRRAIIHNDYETLPNKKGLPSGHAAIIREMVIPIIRSEKILAVLGVGNKSEAYTRADLEIAERFADYAWDITERKRMEVILADERNQLAERVDERTADLSRANANLARALRVKDEFLANMSHELRTPLNAILGLSESLAEQTAGSLNEKQMRYITTVSESGHHLLSLINDILDLAKIEAGQITLDVNKVDIHSVCDASLRMIKQLAKKKNQEFTLEIESDLGLMWADERRLKQMLVNLLSNAVKFTPEGGKLGLEVHGDQDANKVTFTIWDTGIGIKETDLPRLFQPFVQLDSGLARESSGTGLGLALVSQMARMHGGSTSVVSQPGAGSRFSLMLPWEPALFVDTVERLKSTGKFRPIKFNQGQKPTILLIEDTEEVIMMISDYLELNGFKTVIARDGVEGVAQAQLTHPDLILMDIQMPHMDGFEATKKLRSESEFKHTPIIALTALAMPNDRELCLAAGMDEYITKPVHLRALIKVIENFLSGEKETKPE